MKKRIIAMTLALAMVFALAACANGGGDADTQPSPPADGGDSGITAEIPDPIDWRQAGGIGFVNDDVDHWARDPYHIIYFNFNPTGITGLIYDSLQQLQSVANFTIEHHTANNDSDMFINTLQTLLIREPDGIIIDITEELAVRTAEITAQFGVPAICLFNMAVDPHGHMIIPSIIMDQYANGETQLRHLKNVYRDFWGPDMNSEDIALLIVDFSINMNIHARGVGAARVFEQYFPGQPVFWADTAAGSLSAEEGFSVTNAMLAANPDVEYWFIIGTVEDVALGAARAVDAFELGDRALITSSGATILPGEWDAGYDGPWIANYAVPGFLYAGVALFGLLALIDGRATTETLWEESFLPGDRAARFVLASDMMTRANYVEFIGNFMRAFGVDPDAA